MALADLTGAKVQVQWHPTAGVLAEIADGAWTTIDLPIKHLWYRRGYKRGQQRVEAGEFQCTFRDPTRSMDPTKSGTPNYRKGRRQFRVRVTVGSNTYIVFRGITSGWQPDWLMREFTVTMRGTDRSPALEGVFVPSVFEQVAASLAPVYWFKPSVGARPDWAGAGGVILHNFGTAGGPGAAGMGLDLNGQAVLPFDAEPGMSVAETPAGFANFLDATRLTTDFTVTATFVTDEPGAIYTQGPSPGPDIDILLGVSWDPPADRLSIYVDDASSPSVSLHSDQLVSDGAPHIGTGSFDGSVLRLKCDKAAQKVGPLLAPPIPNPRAGQGILGNIRDGTRRFPGRIGHVLLWDYSLTEGQINAVHEAALTPWAGLRSDQVIAKILDYVGIATGERSLEVGQETMGASRCQASALVCCERPAATETGLFFFNREGKATFYARNHASSLGTPRDTAPVPGDGRIKLQDLNIDMDERTFYTVGKAYVSLAEPLEVVYRHANAATEGELVWEPEVGTEYASQAAALAGATRAVGTGAARPHFTNARTLAEVLNFAELLTRDVWDRIGIIGRPGGVEEYQESRILEVEHEMDGVAMTWNCTLTCEATS